MLVRIIRQEGYESPKVKAAQGDVIEVNERLGGKLIASQWAVFVEPPVVEAVVVEPALENTAKRTGRVAKRTPKAGSRRAAFSAEQE